MALDLSKLNRRRGGNSGTPPEAWAVEFIEVILADPKRATPDQDILVGKLMHDAGPFAKDTVIRVKMRDRKDKVKSNMAPLEFFDLPRKKGNHQPVRPGGAIILENCFVDDKVGENGVTCGWFKVATRDPQSGLELIHVGYPVSVERERFEDVNGVRKYRQYRYVAVTQDAAKFSSVDEFREVVARFLSPLGPEEGGGTPGVWVRVVNENEPDEVATARISLTWNGESWDAPDTVVDEWLAQENNASWADTISKVGTPDAEGYIFEVIPFLRYNTGSNSLPSAQNNGRVRDDSEQFQVYVEENGQLVPRRNGDGFVTTNAFAMGGMVVRRMDDQTDQWFAIGTFNQKGKYGELFLREELITDNLPELHKQEYRKRAAARGARNREMADQIRKSAAPEAGASPSEDDFAFGEPDHSGGLSPR